MERPPDLFDRADEWNDLSQFVESSASGSRLALVRGRRRTGKSYLLRRLVAAAGGFYFQAIEHDRQQTLENFGRALGDASGLDGASLRLSSWDDALQQLHRLAGADRPYLVVIDEFPYLLQHSPELPSTLQRFLDDTRGGPGALRVVLCGSALSTMSTLLEGAQALRGRASHDVVISGFDYRTAAAFWGLTDPETAFMVHSVAGGSPGYRDLITAPVPSTSTDFEQWVMSGPLHPSSAAFREDSYLLTEERSFSDRQLYHSVVGAVASGATTQTAVAQALGRDARAVQHPLRALQSAGFLDVMEDALRTRRPIYRLTDPLVRFHQVVTQRDLARFEDRRTVQAWRDASNRFRTHVLGPHFEHLCREFTLRFADMTTTGGSVTTVAPAVVNDPNRRQQWEVDVVALGVDDLGSVVVRALGEAKYSRAQRTLSDLYRLERLRTVVARKKPSAQFAKLLLFSGTGFEPQLTDAAGARSDVELIDLDRLYTGS